MKPQTIEELKALLINAGYGRELNDIFFIEDIEPIEFELIEFDNYEIEPFNYDDFKIEPIEFDELY